MAATLRRETVFKRCLAGVPFQRVSVGERWAVRAVAQLIRLFRIVERRAILAARVQRARVEVPHLPLGSTVAVVAMVNLCRLAAEHFAHVCRLPMIIGCHRGDPAVLEFAEQPGNVAAHLQPQDGDCLNESRRTLGVVLPEFRELVDTEVGEPVSIEHRERVAGRETFLHRLHVQTNIGLPPLLVDSQDLSTVMVE